MANLPGISKTDISKYTKKRSRNEQKKNQWTYRQILCDIWLPLLDVMSHIITAKMIEFSFLFLYSV